MRRFLAILVAVGLCLSAVAPPAAAQGKEGVAVVRRGGADRASTAVAVSRALFPCAKRTACASSVVLVGGASPADALVAGPLAGRLGVPVLFVGEDGPSADTLDEVARLDVETATVVGGRASVSDEALAGLRERGIELDRVAGRDRYETAVAVARLLPGEEVALASGSQAHLVDAALGAALAAALRAPLLLSETESLPPFVAGALAGRAPRRVTLVGGESALGRRVEFQAAEAGGEVERVAGRDRIGTSFAVAARARDHGAGLARVWAAGASATADQLVASSAAGVTGTVVALIAEDAGGGLAPALRDWFAARRRLVGAVELVGGTGVLSGATAQDVADSLVVPRPSPQIALSVEAERERYARGERVLIHASACNVGDLDLVREISGGLRNLVVLNARGSTIAQTREVFTTGFYTFRLDAGECVDLSEQWDPTRETVGDGVPQPISGESPAPPGSYRVRLDWTNFVLPPHAPIYSEPFLITQAE